IFVVDPRHRPIGTVPLYRAMRTRRPVAVEDIMQIELHLIAVEMDQEDVAYQFDQYDLASAAVVGSDGRLLGQITVDDVVDVMREEAEEDIHRLGGITAEGDLHLPPLQTVRRRWVWLLVNLITAVIASATIAVFADTIEQIVALAILMPIVASMGGNAGTQTLTVAVRALATRELTAANAARILWKECIVGGTNGLIFAVLAAFVASLWFASPIIGLVIGLAMIINLLVAGAAGMLIPLGLSRAGVDPAISAGILLTTVTDVVGFFAFLGLAKLIIL
ncbi:MAG: magnesium transporter, partial [Alphaproteobacteria bacterium]